MPLPHSWSEAVCHPAIQSIQPATDGSNESGSYEFEITEEFWEHPYAGLPQESHLNRAMSDEKRYWAITGRIPFDDEDTPFATSEPCTRGDAEAAFRQWMIDTALDTESEDNLRRRVEAGPDGDLADYVCIISSFHSQTPIHHS